MGHKTFNFQHFYTSNHPHHNPLFPCRSSLTQNPLRRSSPVKTGTICSFSNDDGKETKHSFESQRFDFAGPRLGIGMCCLEQYYDFEPSHGLRWRGCIQICYLWYTCFLILRVMSVLLTSSVQRLVTSIRHFFLTKRNSHQIYWDCYSSKKNRMPNM